MTENSASPPGEPADSDQPPLPIPKPKPRPKKQADLPVIERQNWLIHQHFIRKELESCKQLIREQLIETGGECTYALYVQSMIARSEGHITDSTELLQACDKLQTNSPEILKQIGRNLFLVGKYKEAIACYSKASDRSVHRDWEISHQLGVCYLQMKRYDKAEECLKEALESSKHDVTYSTLANMYLEQNHIEKAMDLLKDATSFAPENLDILTTLGLLYLRQGNFHESFKLLGQAMTFDPENYKAILAAGSLMQVHGDFDVALTKYRVSAHKAPESAPLWNNIAMCFYGKKKYVAAVTCLKRATYLAPFDWKILYNLSLLHLTMLQYASAFQFGSAALKLKSKNASIYMLVGIALSHLGEIENARKSYQESYKLDPNNAYLLLNYAVFLHRNNDNRQCLRLIQELEKVVKSRSDLKQDKELQDTAKTLSAALQVGDRLVADTKKTKEKKKGSKGSKQSSNQGSLDKEDAANSAPNEKPSNNLPSLSSVPRGRLPALEIQSIPSEIRKKIPEPLG